MEIDGKLKRDVTLSIAKADRVSMMPFLLKKSIKGFKLASIYLM